MARCSTRKRGERTREISTAITLVRILTILWEIVHEYVLHGTGPGGLL